MKATIKGGRPDSLIGTDEHNVLSISIFSNKDYLFGERLENQYGFVFNLQL